MTETVVEEVWRALIEEFQAKRFTPESEGDVQCFLYHLLLTHGFAANQVHAMTQQGRGHPSYGIKKKPDLIIDGQTIVEIKYDLAQAEVGRYLEERCAEFRNDVWFDDKSKFFLSFAPRRVLLPSTLEHWKMAYPGILVLAFNG